MDLLANRHAILRQLGQGGMGLVFEGVDRYSGRPVAIKRRHAYETSPSAIERFRRADEKQVCHAGACVSCSAIVPENPATKIANCNLKHNCTHLNDDRKNCGACGVVCGPVEDCLSGTCVKLGDHAAPCSKSADCIDKFVCSKSDNTCRCPLRQNFCGGPGYDGKCSSAPCP